jgi:hypothetical protein
MDHGHRNPHEQQVETYDDGRQAQQKPRNQSDQRTDYYDGQDVTYDTASARTSLVRDRRGSEADRRRVERLCRRWASKKLSRSTGPQEPASAAPILRAWRDPGAPYFTLSLYSTGILAVQRVCR